MLPKHFYHKLKLFQPSEAEKLSLFQEPDINYRIKLEKINDKNPEAPWESLYNISKEKLLILYKELTNLLNKGFIHISWSPAVSPVLFAKKSGGGLQFCVNYRALNVITKKDCYPLPLIHETLNQINKIKWFTKLNISAAFYKLQITKK